MGVGGVKHYLSLVLSDGIVERLVLQELSPQYVITVPFSE